MSSCSRRTRLLLFLLVLAASSVTTATLFATDSIEWKSIGPGGGGNMFSASVSPGHPDIVLMGGDVGGIFRSGDGGVTWSLRNGALTKPDRFSGYGIYGHFGFDPVNPANVYF